MNPEKPVMFEIPDYQLRVFEKEQIECKDIRQLMCDYADGELTSSLKARLDTHMECCPNCAHFRDTYQKTIQLAKELPSKKLDSDAQNRLRKALNAKLGLNLSSVG